MQVNGEVQKRAEDMLGEVAISQTLASLGDASAGGGRPADQGREIVLARPVHIHTQLLTLSPSTNLPDRPGWTSGFVASVGVGVARGRYPPALLQEWHRWDEEFASENDPVDNFGDDQLYTVGE